MKTIVVRPAVAADIDPIASLFDAYRQFYGQPADLALARRFIADRFGKQESVLLVAGTGAPIAAFCQLYPTFCSVEARKILTLYDLFVAPAARQHGLGRALLLAAEQFAKDEGYARMDLTTARTNAPAQALYESLGWQRDEVFFAYNRHIRP
ncbi:GNAT family N-acetyltransferase [Aquabacterium sp.]|uniref:GNAT family N-acetyltransferase n=1 Tax=Aquabacterium sp. TaxID=1872578 RepID=UPI002BEC4360|nr:GNAT family N-acetyltransferase [Aquabacterium sp.]HSW03470.1 GNAT family N-acetyltransferase [Aquabacterium sp.]